MKGLFIGAFLWLSSLVAVMAAIAAVLRYHYDTRPSDAIGVSLFAGFFCWLALCLVRSAIQAWRERASLKAGIAGAAPIDGRAAILVGHIEPAAGASLTAPLSGRPCVAYTFEIYDYRGSGKTGTKAVYCDGIAVTRSLIVTASGSYQLLAVPELDMDEVDLDRDRAVARAKALLPTLPIEPPHKPFSRPKLEDQWSDADGSYERLRQHMADEELNWPVSKLSERVLERGARVCVFGRYSAAKRAIVADPDDWSKITRIMKGDPDSIIRQLGASVIRRMIGATIAAAVSVGILAAFLSSSLS